MLELDQRSVTSGDPGLAKVNSRFVSRKAGKLGYSAVALIFVVCSYYYAAYRPTWHPEPEAERKPEVEQLAYPKVEEDSRTKFDVLEAERERQVTSARYELCLSMAQKNYQLSWAANCKTISERDRKRHETCIAQVEAKAVCAPLSRKPSETCALPVELAGRLNKGLEISKRRCQPELGTALPIQP